MALPVIASTYRVAFNWTSTLLTTTAENVMHFRESGTGVELLSAALLAHVSSGMWQQTDQTSHISSLDITALDGSALTQHLSTGSTAAFSGNGVSTDPIPQVAVLVKHITGVRGRSHRGRSYLPWLVESLQSKGQYLESTRASQEVAWGVFLSSMRTDGWDPVVASYTLASAEDITSYVVEPLTATVRRRQKR